MAAELGQERLVSLDVFRGMTIAGMVLVNNPGTWSAMYPPLAHADWHGATPTDFVFPFFLFIVGVAIPIALGKRLVEGVTRDVYFKIASRAALIFFFGLLMAAFPLFDLSKAEIPGVIKIVGMFGLLTIMYFWLTDKKVWAVNGLSVMAVFFVAVYLAGYPLEPFKLETLRIPGVLQRIAVCYLIVAVLFLHTSWKQLTAIGVGLLLGYWLLMTVAKVPGCEITTIDSKECNIAAYVDRAVIGVNHIWRSAKVYDPEGILSTIPALVTTISGVLTGLWIKSERTPSEKVRGMLVAGVVLTVLAFCWNPFFPFNKALWTSSYVLYTSGIALLILGFCYFLIDIKGYKTWTKPFVIFGVNALALFIGSGLMGRVMGIMKVTGADGKDVSLQPWIYTTIFVPIGDAKFSSLLFALSFILFWLFLMWLLYRKRIFIRV